MRILIVEDPLSELAANRRLIDTLLRHEREERNLPIMTLMPPTVAEQLANQEPNTEILPPEDGAFPEAMKGPPPRSLALVMMVRNARQGLDRTLDSVPVSLLSELVVVDTGSTDDTLSYLEAWAKRHNLPIGILQYTPSTHPDSFFPDIPESYPVPLPPELNLPHTGEQLLCDWGAVRTLALTAANTAFQLMLDADDELVGGPLLGEYLNVMVEQNIDVGFTMLTVKMGDKPLETVPCWRLFRTSRTRSGEIFFSGPTHERLKFPGGLTRTLMLKDGLSVVDHRSTADDNGRSRGRAFKVLWRHIALQGGLDSDKVEPRYLFHLGQEVLQYNQGSLPRQILEKYINRSTEQDPEDRCRAYTTLALFDERDGNLDQAAETLESACALIPESEGGAEERHHLVRMLHTLLLKGWDSLKARRLLEHAKVAVKLTDKHGAHGDLPNLMAGTFYVIANTALRLGQRDKAVNAIRRGLQLRPHNDHFLRLAKQARMPVSQFMPKKKSKED